jgi:hypothetical protein
VSYDIYFVRRDPGQSFEDALDATEESFEGDPGPLSAVELEQWDEVLPAARAVLGDVEEFSDETTRELNDRDTGIELSLFNGEMAIRVPLDEQEDETGEIMARVYELARAVERVTGLEGYDPQTGSPVSDQVGGAVAAGGRQEERAWDDDDDSESDGTSTTLPAVRPRRSKTSASDTESDQSERRPWEFWKR